MKKTPLNKISKKPHRIAKRFVPAKILKEVHKRSGWICEFHDVFRCTEDCMPQPHHKLKRSQGGKHTLENLMDCCFFHHVWIENNSKKAMELGYHIPFEGWTKE